MEVITHLGSTITMQLPFFFPFHFFFSILNFSALFFLFWSLFLNLRLYFFFSLFIIIIIIIIFPLLLPYYHPLILFIQMPSMTSKLPFFTSPPPAVAAATNSKKPWLLAAGVLSLVAFNSGFGLPCHTAELGTAATPAAASVAADSHAALVAKTQQCAIDNLHDNLDFLKDATPIKPDEFLVRRDRLARALVESGVDAFALEPGYTFQ